MQAFVTGLEQLRLVDVPLECVPPDYREEAAADVAAAAAAAAPGNASAAVAAPASGRKLSQFVDPLATPVDFDALHAAAAAAAARAAAGARLQNLKALFLNLRVTEFATAIFELVTFEQITENLNVQDVFSSFFTTPSIQVRSCDTRAAACGLALPTSTPCLPACHAALTMACLPHAESGALPVRHDCGQRSAVPAPGRAAAAQGSASTDAAWCRRRGRGAGGTVDDAASGRRRLMHPPRGALRMSSHAL